MKVVLSPNPYRDRGLKAAQAADKILRNVGVQTVMCLPFALEGNGVEFPKHIRFGDMEAEPHAGCEMRVSWTPSVSPEGADAGAQVSVWAQFLRASVNDGERTVIG